MVVFNGTVKVRVIEAAELRPTEWSTRFNSLTTAVVPSVAAKAATSKESSTNILDPYVSIDVDEYHVGNTTVKSKTATPKWEEEFSSEVHNGEQVGFTVFHKTAIPPDDFVANARIGFEDLNKQVNDFWVSRHFLCSAKAQSCKCLELGF